MAGMAVVLLCWGLAARGDDGAVDFNRDVRPILSTKCLRCHGPDETARKAGLRLDVRERAVAALKDGAIALAISPLASSHALWPFCDPTCSVASLNTVISGRHQWRTRWP
jgi:hypothetical protein